MSAAPLNRFRRSKGWKSKKSLKLPPKTQGTFSGSMQFNDECKNVLFTGPPRCGKTTLIERFVEKLNRSATGFFTKEIKEAVGRVGFVIQTLDGKEAVLAHRNIESKYRVGAYGVVAENIDKFAVPAMTPKKPDEIVIIDEIGKMECFSTLFKERLVAVFDSENPVVGTVSLKGNRFIQKIKKRKDVLLIHITEINRDELLFKLCSFYAVNPD
jgi:nucleoside-triphosphatase THEP1